MHSALLILPFLFFSLFLLPFQLWYGNVEVFMTFTEKNIENLQLSLAKENWIKLIHKRAHVPPICTTIHHRTT
jgi:hypothetical protein